tara:strand:- start:7638 stop:8498 length:861 start_codon:yes stop_codon:yes gene_type:complete
MMSASPTHVADEASTVFGVTEGLNEPYGTYKPTALQSEVIRFVRANRIFRGAVRTRANRLVQWLRAGPIDDTLVGWKFRFFPAENTGDRKAMLSPHQFDLAERDLLAQELAPNSLFLDIGSNIGVYTFSVARSRPDVRILSFEPSPRVFAKLSFNLRLNDLESRVVAHNIALSDAKGKMGFDLSLESLVLGTSDIDVPTEPLLSVLEKANVTAVGAMKIDVEGAEDKVLRPFFESAPFALWPEIIIIEAVFPEQWEWNCLNFLRTSGYDEIWRGGMNIAFRKQALS